jgi:uncharacterized membrane protein YphA (DoxX/SURF4 family)
MPDGFLLHHITDELNRIYLYLLSEFIKFFDLTSALAVPILMADQLANRKADHHSRGPSLTLLRTLLFQSPWPYRLMRVLLGAIFVIAGGSKLLDPRAFARIISAYGLLPEELLVPVAIGVPAIEILAGAGLLLNARGSLKIICGLLAGFLFVLGYAIWKNLDVDCGCFSQLEIEAGKNLHAAFIRDLGLMAVSFYLIFWQRFQNRFQVQYRFHRNSEDERSRNE